ncbi:putative aldehyde dehydrogenase (NAD(+)) [Helianthus annuus]|nr:putative aldehyde dehydrogenase (NAD(+)) [Helianthus annuus]
MAFWWPLIVIAFAYVICKFLLMLIPSNVPSIDVDASDVIDDGHPKENSFIYIPSRRQTDKVQCYEPATMKYLGYFPALKPDEVKERVAQVRKSQVVWAKSSFKQRRQFLRVLLKYILEHQELICEVSSRDTGKTMVDASMGEIMTTCEKITWLLSEGEKWLKPEHRSCGRSMLHKTAKVEFHPLGVVGAIVSWNYPFHNLFNPVLAAVFSGNGIVVKVSEHASWSGCFYVRILQSALAAVGAPENLVEVITGFAETGEALVSSVDKMIFVGSPGVGKMIMRKAADTLIPVTLELGGKDPFIVCEDVDVPHVAQVAVRAALQSSGQNCAGAERFYVHKDVYSAFVAAVVKIVKSVTAGPPQSGKYDMGAICMQDHSERLQSLINDALDKGAEIVGGGSVRNISEGAVDQYFPPTVIVNVNHQMRLMQEEAFGPIMPIMKFSSDEEAIRLANDSKYGLGCAVFSGSQRRARFIASQLHCGVAAINDFASNYMCQSLPFGGVKDSGFGRFAGVEGLRACCLVKSVVEDRWWPLIKTKIPKPIQYPVAENAFEFQQSLVEALYGFNVWDRLRALVNVLKMLTEQNSPVNTKRSD